MMTLRRSLCCRSAIIAAIAASVLAATQGPALTGQDARLEKIHERFVFVDTHSHPSQFHRANVDRVLPDELERYRKGLIDVVVCNVSSDAAYQGGYVNRDGTALKRLQAPNDYPLKPGDAFTFTLDRFRRILKTTEDGGVALALTPDQVLRAKKAGKLAVMAALEGADGLEAKIENLRQLHAQGLRLLQLVHFRANELGSVQTGPYKPSGLLPFGEEAVRECNRLGIVIDLAHACTDTIMGAVKISKDPVIFSHTGVKALHEGSRNVTDEEIRAIASKGGLIGIWPSSSYPTMADMVRDIDYVKNLVGIDNVSIGSDLRGMSYTKEFGEEANFRAIAQGMAAAGYSDEEIGKVMGGNFFKLWQTIAK